MDNLYFHDLPRGQRLPAHLAYFIGIDGPAAAGKTTAAKAIAKALNFIYIDTGAFYRAIAFWFIEDNKGHGLWFRDKKPDLESIHEILTGVPPEYERPFKLSAKWDEIGNQTMYLDDCPLLDEDLRTEEVSQASSQISTLPIVRAVVRQAIHSAGYDKNIVMEGRDVCTSINPQATCKIFLTADRSARAMRRYQELIRKAENAGKPTQDIQLDKIEADLAIRDNRDMTRTVDPLYKANDSIEIDNTALTPEETVQHILAAAAFRGVPVIPGLLSLTR